MATPKPKEDPAKKLAANAGQENPLTETAEIAPSEVPQDQQIAELKELTRSLMGAVQAMQTQSARNAVFQDAIADVKLATKAMLVAPTASAARVGYGETPTALLERDCDCSPCDCVSDGCCCFEIVLDKVRGIQPQREPADSGDTVLVINELEVRLFASIDNIGVLIPSLSTTMGIRLPRTGGPGLWLPLGAVIGRVCLKKGTTRTITVDFQGSEIDEGVERPIGLKDEHGAASGTITLDCCCSKIYPPVPTDLSFDQGGTGGGRPGAISLAFSARRVCC